MNVILSLVLCLAMLLGGGSNLPAEPETATTWTLRNAVLTLGDESVEIAPEARFTIAAGSERATLHFEFGDGEQVRMPISLEAAPDALRFALSDAGRAYNLSAEDLEKIFYEMNGFPVDGEMMEILSGYIYGYGALMASMFHDPAGMRQHREELTRLLFERCATLEGETQVEIDGQSYPAQKFRLKSDSAMLDALRECDWPELADFLNSTLNLLNYSAGASARSFEEFYASAAGEQAAQAMAAMPELLLNVCETEEFTYFGCDGMEFQSDANPGFTLQTGRAESILRADGATSTVEMILAVNGTMTEIDLNEEIAGDPYDPDSIDLDCDISFVPEAESSAERLDFGMTFDAAKDAEGNFSGALRLVPPVEIDGAMLPFDELVLAFAPGSEDGATSISLTATDAGEIFAGLGFEILRSEAAPADYFEGAQMYEFTVDAVESDEASPLMMALFADVSQLSLDGATLLREPSIQAAGEMIQRFAAETTAGETDAYGDSDYDGGDEEAPEVVTTRQEAEAIFDGELPDYQPPEGYALSRIEALPDEAILYYAGAEGEAGFSVLVYAGDGDGARSYICADGAARELTAPIATVYPLEDGTFYSAYVNMPNGQYLSFEFDKALNHGELSEFLGGLTK